MMPCCSYREERTTMVFFEKLHGMRLHPPFTDPDEIQLAHLSTPGHPISYHNMIVPSSSPGEAGIVTSVVAMPIFKGNALNRVMAMVEEND